MHGQAGNLTPERRAWLASFRADTSRIDALTRDATLRAPTGPRVPGEREARSIEDVTRGLGLDARAASEIQASVGTWLQAPNDLGVRGRMLPELRRLVADPIMRGTVYRRVLECYRAQGAPGEELEKGKSHKYIKRVPTGKQRPKWRYIYKLTRKRGEGVVDDQALETGAKLQVAHRGEVGHFEVLGHQRERGLVHVRHDESGRDAHIKRTDLQRMVAAYHAKRGTPAPEPRKPRKKADKPDVSADMAATAPPAAEQPAAEQPAPAPKPIPPPPTPGGIGLVSLQDLQTGTFDQINGFHPSRADAERAAHDVASTGREVALVPQPGGFVVVSRDHGKSQDPTERRYDGAAADLYLRGKSGPEKVPARWVLVEADDLIASHDAIRFHQRQDYPSDVQERRYHEIDAEQGKVDRIARKLEPAIVANTNPDAINGAPIIVQTDKGLAVLGGNGRTMAAQRAFEMYPESADALRAHLAHVAPQFGLSAARVKAMKKPMLVRQMDAADASTQSLRLLGRRMNEGLTQGLDPRSEEVAIAKTLVNDDVLQTLAAGIGDDQTLPDYLTGNESRPFVSSLMRAGVIDEISAAQFVDQETGLLNEQGRSRAERVLAARVLPDASMLDRMNPSLRANLALSTASLIAAEQEGWDLRGPLMAAVQADLDMRARGFKAGQKEITRYLAQRELGAVEGPAAAVQQDPVAARLLTVVREHNKGRVLPRALRGVALRAKSAKHQAGSLPGIFDAAPETVTGALDAEFSLKPPPEQQASLFASLRPNLNKARTMEGGKKARARLYARAQGLAEMIVRERMGAAMGAGLKPTLDAGAIAAEVRRDLARVLQTDRTLRGAALPSATALDAMVEAQIAVGRTSLSKARGAVGLVTAPPGGGWEPPTAKRRAWRKMGPHGHIYWYGGRGKGGPVYEEGHELDVDAQGRTVRRVTQIAARPATPKWAESQGDMVADFGEVRRATELVGRVQRKLGDAAPPALAAMARMRKSDFADGVVTAKIPFETRAQLMATLGSQRGEGSRGGHIVRHTASGHPVYAPSGGKLRVRRDSLPVDVLRRVSRKHAEEAEGEFAEGQSTLKTPYKPMYEEIYGEPSMSKARRVKPGPGQGSFDFTAEPAAATPAAPAPTAIEAPATPQPSEQSPAPTPKPEMEKLDKLEHDDIVRRHGKMASVHDELAKVSDDHRRAYEAHSRIVDSHWAALRESGRRGGRPTAADVSPEDRRIATEQTARLHESMMEQHERASVEAQKQARAIDTDAHERSVHQKVAEVHGSAALKHLEAVRHLRSEWRGLHGHSSLDAKNATDRASMVETWAAKQMRLRTPPEGFVPIAHSKHGGWHKLAGDSYVYWYPGDEAPHVGAREGDAPTAPVAPPVAARAAVTFISRRSSGRDDNYRVGAIVRVKNGQGGGGADGKLFEVTKVHRKWRDDDTDEWMIRADVRPATGPKADKIDRERQAAKDKADAVAATVALIEQTGVVVPEEDARKLPDGEVFVVRAGVHGSGVESMRLTPDGRAIWFHGGHYDDYRATQRVSTDPAAVDALRRLIGMKKSQAGDEIEHADPKRVRKGGRDMTRKTLSKGGGAAKPPPGFERVPHGSHGGYRKRTSAGYRYWYPSQGRGGNERSHAIAHHEAMREHHRAAGAAATGDAQDAHVTAEMIHASAFARHVQGSGSKDSRRRASMQADQASGMADFGLDRATARLLTEKPHRPHAGLGEPEGVGLAKATRIGALTYVEAGDAGMAEAITGKAIVPGSLAPMTKSWPLQARSAQNQRVEQDLKAGHDDQAGHWGAGGLAQWWQDTYAGQTQVTVPIWLQQPGLPYGTPTPAVAQRSLTAEEEALARVYNAADPRCATGLRLAEAQRQGVKVAAG